MSSIYELAADRQKYIYFEKESYPVDKDAYSMAHFHKSIEMIFALTGRTDVIVNGEQITLNPGEIGVVDSFEIHYYLHDHEASRYIILVSSEYLSDLRAMFPNEKLVTKLGNTEVNRGIFQIVEHWFNAFSREDYLINKSVINLIMSIFFKYYPREMQKETAMVGKMLKYIDAHSSEPITLEALAAHVGYSKNYCSHIFNKYIGKTIMMYLGNIRAEKAHQLLLDDAMKKKSVVDLAYHCGFDSISSFYRAYKRRFHTLPRRKLQENIHE